jgi:hypothetical protein
VALGWDEHGEASPLPGIGNLVLNFVAAVRPDDAWAVGWRGTGYLVQSQAFVEHSGGSR